MTVLKAAPAIETDPLDDDAHAVAPGVFSGLPAHLEQRREQIFPQFNGAEIDRLRRFGKTRT